MAMLSTSALVKKSKPTLAAMVARAKGDLVKFQEHGEAIAEKALTSTTAFGSFTLGYYIRRRVQLKGKRVTFDQAGKLDIFAITGAAAMIVGATPLLGEAGRYVGQIGAGFAAAGSVDFVDKLAKDHHNAK